MRPLLIKIPGNPISKKRPQFTVRGGKGMAYNAQETEEGRTFLLIKDAIGQTPEWMIEHPLSVHFFFKFKRPKSHYGTGRNSAVLKPSSPVHMMGKPDVDNLAKFYMDVLNFIWADDCHVIFLTVSKEWSDTASTTIIIKPYLDGEELMI